ncbi:MAG: hypothetical protein H7210_04830 [Pyrinomonadaceae bacterium]|nr:hypothetical protein [Phycisphaerales bacterium]
MPNLISRRASAVAFAAAAAFLSAPANADTVFATADPGGFFGYIGFDIYTQQSVAARFTPEADHTLDQVNIWFMSNDFEGTTPQTVTVTLRTDFDPKGEYVSAPSETILETWTIDVPVVGWSPLLQPLGSVVHPVLQAGQRYWVVTESSLGAGVNPIWVWSSEGNEFTATNQGPGTPWQSGSGAAVGIRVIGTPVPTCRADFNGDTVVNSQDFFDFLAAFFAETPAGDFNGDSVINSQDFFDFVATFFEGC